MEYMYPSNLKSKAMLWLWELRDIAIIGTGFIISVLMLAQTHIYIPIVLTSVYAFLTIRFEDTSILDFIKYSVSFFMSKQQFYQ